MPWVAIVIAFVAIIAVILSAVAQAQSAQSENAIIPEVALVGEYRIDGGEWQAIRDGEHISTTKGTVELKGIFKLYYGETGEELGAVDSGTVISLYLNHVKVNIKDASGNVWESDNENFLGENGLCSEMWTQYTFRGNVGDEVIITVYNPHFYGNDSAVDDFLKKICIYNVENVGALSKIGALTLTVGILLAVFLVVLIGAAIFATLFHQRNSGEIWLLWLMVFFGGLYFIFSRDKISVWNPMYALNTTLLGSSMMMYVITAYAIIRSFMEGTLKRIVTFATVLIGAASLGAMLTSLIPSLKFYDTYPYWTFLAAILSVILTVCIAISFSCCEKNDGGVKKKHVYITAIAVLTSFLADVIATFFGAWQGGMLSVAVLLLIVLTASVVIGRVVPRSIRAVLAAKSIEAEKREMEMKLKESHISIMLSQIQPHFLYNTLNSVYYLCETNPMRAKSMVNSFSEYLRNNLSSLEETKLISFETELSHINTYLDIEKIRFEDTLEIEYDIRSVDFSLPVLTVQPIVENAVKHGTSKKRGGGKVTISTFEDKANYIIKVSDTGCGFDLAKPKNDGKRHVGIENVRQRLANMCDGSLTIESEVGVGTVATIKIPKGDKK